MRWVFSWPFGARFLLAEIPALVLTLHFSQAITWADGNEGTEDLLPQTAPLSLTIVWYDSYNLLPKSFEPMKREVDRLFDEIGVNLNWKRGETVVPDDVLSDSLSVNVVLLPSDPKDWGLGRRVMGLATHRPGFKGAVYVLRPGILRTLGLGGLGDVAQLPGAMVGLARAVGRVVAHEVIHFVMPQYPHRKSGLMNGTMNRSFLTRLGVHIDGRSSKALRAELALKTVQLFAANGEEQITLAVTNDPR